MASTGLVLKPLSPAEAQRSRSLSGAAPAKAADKVKNAQFNDAIFINELAQTKQDEASHQNPFDLPTIGTPSPGGGMLSHESQFLLAENRTVEEGAQSFSRASGASQPNAGKAMGAYMATQASINHTMMSNQGAISNDAEQES